RASERLQGVISFHELAMPICDLFQSASPMPTARSMPREVVASMPSVTVRERGLWSMAGAEVPEEVLSGMRSRLLPGACPRRRTRSGGGPLAEVCERRERLGDLGRPRHAERGERLAWARLQPEVAGLQRREGVFVGDVVAREEHGIRRGVAPQVLDRLALRGGAHGELEHVLALADGEVVELGGRLAQGH